jgi:nitrate/TMAO reductase-like tetraheme cytochrome c subunit
MADLNGDHARTDRAGRRSGSRSGGAAPANLRARRLVIWGAVAAVVLVVLTVSLVYTEQSSFCPTCHEMRPYYQAWTVGGHVRSAQCVDCHVDPGLLAHLAHKPIALKEVWDHFFRDNRFPNFTVDIPNSRCIRCHPNVPNKSGSLFSHARHVGRAACKDCHAQAGHTVSLASLAAEGVLKTNVSTPSIAPSGTPSSIAGHIKVICQSCHDQAKMRCSSCHQAPHENRGECSNCHKPGAAFTASHPAGTDCASCHKPPAKHFGSDCAACHTPGTPFARTTFTHPATHHDYRSRPCVKCHPNGYTTVNCTCHGGNPPSGD